MARHNLSWRSATLHAIASASALRKTRYTIHDARYSCQACALQARCGSHPGQGSLLAKVVSAPPTSGKYSTVRKYRAVQCLIALGVASVPWERRKDGFLGPPSGCPGPTLRRPRPRRRLKPSVPGMERTNRRLRQEQYLVYLTSPAIDGLYPAKLYSSHSPKVSGILLPRLQGIHPLRTVILLPLGIRPDPPSHQP